MRRVVLLFALAAALSMVRYVGVAFIPVAMLVAYYWTRRWKVAVIGGIVSGIPLLTWLLRNANISGSIWPGNDPPTHSLWQCVRYTVEGFPAFFGGVAAPAALVLLAAVMIAALDSETRGARVLAAVSGVFFSLVVLWGVSATRAIGDHATRQIFPLASLVIFLVAWALDSDWTWRDTMCQAEKRWLWLATVLMAALVAASAIGTMGIVWR